MRQLIRVVLGLAAATAVAACGSRGTTSTAGTSDTAIAGRILAHQLFALQTPAGHGWRENGTAAEKHACSDSLMGWSARAISPTLLRGRLELRIAIYMFPNATTAQRGLVAFLAESLQRCRGRSLARSLRQRGSIVVARPVDAGWAGYVGRGGQTAEITVLSRYRGRSFAWTLDTTPTRHGRVVEVVYTLAGASTAQYNELLAQRLIGMISFRGLHRD
jgi:hypothetical protein